MKILGSVIAFVVSFLSGLRKSKQADERDYRIFKELSKSDEERDDAEIDRLRYSGK